MFPLYLLCQVAYPEGVQAFVPLELGIETIRRVLPSVWPARYSGDLLFRLLPSCASSLQGISLQAIIAWRVRTRRLRSETQKLGQKIRNLVPPNVALSHYNNNVLFTYCGHCSWYYQCPLAVQTHAFLRSICRHLHFIRNHTKSYTFKHICVKYL